MYLKLNAKFVKFKIIFCHKNRFMSSTFEWNSRNIFDEFQISWNGEIKLDEIFSLWNREDKFDEFHGNSENDFVNS